jgi:hypothetical protein
LTAAMTTVRRVIARARRSLLSSLSVNMGVFSVVVPRHPYPD